MYSILHVLKAEVITLLLLNILALPIYLFIPYTFFFLS